MALLNVISRQSDLNKICRSVKNQYKTKYQYLKKKIEDIFCFCLLIQIHLKVIHLTSVMPAKILKIMILV